MPSVPILVNSRQKRQEIIRRNPTGRAGLGCAIFLSLFTVSMAFGMAIFYAQLTYNLPSPDILPTLLEPPNGTLLQPTQLYDRSGTHLLLALQDPQASGKQYVKLDKGNPLVEATLATADPGFWRHPGFSLEGLGQGTHPTLAQRLVSDLVLWNEPPGLNRDLRERLLAAQITARFGREKVLEWYLNSVQYGPLIYGADAAAHAYLGKKASELTLPEAALLAAAAEAPELDPRNAPQIVLDRQKQVIFAMLEQGMIATDQASQAAKESLVLQPAQKATSDPAPAFTNLVLEQLYLRFGQARVRQGGLRVQTTLDYDLQTQAACATAAQLQRMQGSQNGFSPEDEEKCQAARLLPTMPTSGELPSKGLAANVVVLDPLTGQVLAMVGETTPGLDPAHLPGHPPGSLLTPFIYLTAFSRGLGPGSLVWDIPSSLPPVLAEDHNLDEQFHGPVRLRTAFANDYLVPAVQLLAQVGPENVELTVQQSGLLSVDRTNLEDALYKLPLLSGGEVSLLEVSQAYGVFANQGILAGQLLSSNVVRTGTSQLTPIAILKTESYDGQIWINCIDTLVNCSPQARPVVSSQLAYEVTNVLSDETARWPSLGHPNPLEIGRPAGAKLGRTGAALGTALETAQNAWAVGFTPQIVAGVWMGNEPHSVTTPQDDRLATQGAAALWHAIIQYASRNLPPANWAVPVDIKSMEVCDPSGLLPTAICPTIVNEIFLSGNEPTHPDILYRVFQVNRETGRMATIFTPPELVEDRIYLVVPPEAMEWAQSANLPTPPEAYDIIYAPASPISGAQVTNPEMFADVSGKVSIRGSAGGEGFKFYRLQVGKGLNPHEWIQIGGDGSSPVNNGVLGEWNTAGLSGLYAIQLLVVRQDQRVDTTTVQVTVDNQSPVVHILHPAEKQHFITSRVATVVLDATASDDLDLARVEFYLDGKLVGSLSQSPFTISWQVTAGQHTLLVKAIDLAQNTSEAKVSFSVGK